MNRTSFSEEDIGLGSNRSATASAKETMETMIITTAVAAEGTEMSLELELEMEPAVDEILLAETTATITTTTTPTTEVVKMEPASATMAMVIENEAYGSLFDLGCGEYGYGFAYILLQ